MENKEDAEILKKLQKLHEEMGFFSGSNQETPSKEFKKSFQISGKSKIKGNTIRIKLIIRSVE